MDPSWTRHPYSDEDPVAQACYPPVTHGQQQQHYSVGASAGQYHPAGPYFYSPSSTAAGGSSGHGVIIGGPQYGTGAEHGLLPPYNSSSNHNTTTYSGSSGSPHHSFRGESYSPSPSFPAAAAGYPIAGYRYAASASYDTSPLDGAGAGAASSAYPLGPGPHSNTTQFLYPGENPSSAIETQNPHYCDHPGCTKHYPRLCDLRKHMKRHQKPFQCREEKDHCDTFFSTEKDRDRHERSKHRREEHLICTVCSHRTARKDNMKDHVRRRHGEDRIDEIMISVMAGASAGEWN